MEELETIDDDTDEHGIQFVKSNDVKLAHEIGIFSFPALVYYETGVPIMYDGKFWFVFIQPVNFCKKNVRLNEWRKKCVRFQFYIFISFVFV